jgi:hypothetical protein
MFEVFNLKPNQVLCEEPVKDARYKIKLDLSNILSLDASQSQSLSIVTSLSVSDLHVLLSGFQPF